MRKLKRLAAIMFMALLVSLCAPTCFAGYIPNGIAGQTQSPGVYGEMDTPGLNGQMDTPPAVNGEMGAPGLAGDMATGLYAAIISFFG